MTKPFNHQELLARIKAQLNLSTLHRAQLHAWLSAIMTAGHHVPGLGAEQQPQQPAGGDEQLGPGQLLGLASQRRSRLDELLASVSPAASPLSSPKLTPPASPSLSPRATGSAGGASPAAGLAGRPGAARPGEARPVLGGGSGHSGAAAAHSSGALLGSSGSSNLTASSSNPGSTASSWGAGQGLGAHHGAAAAAPAPSASGTPPGGGGFTSHSASSGSPVRGAGSGLLLPWELQHVQSQQPRGQPGPGQPLLPGCEPACADALYHLQRSPSDETLAASQALASADRQRQQGAAAGPLHPPPLPRLRTSLDSDWPASARRASSASAAPSCGSLGPESGQVEGDLERPTSPSSFGNPLIRHRGGGFWAKQPAAQQQQGAGAPGPRPRRDGGSLSAQAPHPGPASAFGSSFSGWSASQDKEEQRGGSTGGGGAAAGPGAGAAAHLMLLGAEAPGPGSQAVEEEEEEPCDGAWELRADQPPPLGAVAGAGACGAGRRNSCSSGSTCSGGAWPSIPAQAGGGAAGRQGA
jgi:hypothetical protein